MSNTYQRSCTQCGQTGNLDSPYCSYCGTSFQQDQPMPYTPGNQPQQPYEYQQPNQYNQTVNYQQPQQPMVPGQPNYAVPNPNAFARPKDKIAAALLAFFLGSFGVHGFYLGNKNMGMILLLITLASIPLSCIVVGFFGFLVVGVIQVIQTILYLVADDYEFQQKYVVEKRWF